LATAKVEFNEVFLNLRTPIASKDALARILMINLVQSVTCLIEDSDCGIQQASTRGLDKDFHSI
jgi:hypothetical protein